jgi:hypothetical protein
MTKFTRKSRAVKGRLKVYFSLHPDDFDMLVRYGSEGAPAGCLSLVEVFRDALGVVERGTFLKVTDLETDEDKSVAFETIALPKVSR